jgi:hypothetical protein
MYSYTMPVLNFWSNWILCAQFYETNHYWCASVGPSGQPAGRAQAMFSSPELSRVGLGSAGNHVRFLLTWPEPDPTQLMIKYIYMYRVGRFCPDFGRNLNQIRVKIQFLHIFYRLKSIWGPLWTNLTGLPVVWNFLKPYLPHSKSKWNVSHMHSPRQDLHNGELQFAFLAHCLHRTGRLDPHVKPVRLDLPILDGTPIRLDPSKSATLR